MPRRTIASMIEEPAEPGTTPPPLAPAAPQAPTEAPAPAPVVADMSPAMRARYRQLLRAAALKVVADRRRMDESVLAWDGLLRDAVRDGVPRGLIVAAAGDADPDGIILGDIPG